MPTRKQIAFTDSALTGNTSGTAANVSGTPALPNGTTATTQSQADASTKLATTAYVDTGLGTKQATLVSATNIKTINGSTVLGSGDLVVTGSAANQNPNLLVQGADYSLLADYGMVVPSYYEIGSGFVLDLAGVLEIN